MRAQEEFDLYSDTSSQDAACGDQMPNEAENAWISVQQFHLVFVLSPFEDEKQKNWRTISGSDVKENKVKIQSECCGVLCNSARQCWSHADTRDSPQTLSSSFSFWFSCAMMTAISDALSSSLIDHQAIYGWWWKWWRRQEQRCDDGAFISRLPICRWLHEWLFAFLLYSISEETDQLISGLSHHSRKEGSNLWRTSSVRGSVLTWRSTQI